MLTSTTIFIESDLLIKILWVQNVFFLESPPPPFICFSGTFLVNPNAFHCIAIHCNSNICFYGWFETSKIHSFQIFLYCLSNSWFTMSGLQLSPSEVWNINVGVLGHVDSGKTSLGKCQFFPSMVVKSLSAILSTASLDKNPQSRQRGISLDRGFSAFLSDIPSYISSSLQVELIPYATNINTFSTLWLIVRSM